MLYSMPMASARVTKLRSTEACSNGVEDAPVRADAALEVFPGLIDRLDDVVFHADGLGAGDEVTQHGGLLERPGIGVEQIVAGARPAEFCDHDPLARKFLAQQLI